MKHFTFEPGERSGFAKPTDPVTPGWVVVGASAEGLDFDLSGVNPWARGTTDWTPLHRWIVAAHPTYPHQRHRADVYRIDGPDGRVVTFAAAELSANVWGFYSPDAPVGR